MKEVTIRSYQRKNKEGKLVTVKGYTRRVGIKGQRSPKRKKFSVEAAPGEELKEVVRKKEKPAYTGPRMTKEEIAIWDAAANRSGNISVGRLKQLGERKSTPVRKMSSYKSVRNPLSEKGSLTILERVEKKINNFISKYDPKRKE